MKKSKLVLLILNCIFLVNCGGGGGGSSSGPSNLPLRKISLENRKNSKEEIPTDERELNGSTMKVGVLEVDSEDDEHSKEVIAALKKNNEIGTILKFTDEEASGREEIELYNKLYSELENEKIKIINHSYGAEEAISKREIEKDKDIIELVNFYKEKVNKGDSLFVWANGNELEGKEKDFPDAQAGIPQYYPELEKGWISAVGIESVQESGNDIILGTHYKDHLAYPGSKAKWWSISANAQSAREPKNKENIGSSYAAPRVTAAAALVAEKFPWMTVDQIRQTIFTTAMKPELKITERMKELIEKEEKNGELTDDEEREVLRLTRNKNLIPDEKYGWGILAFYEYGPGAFTNIHSDRSLTPNFTANVPEDYESYFEHDIHGEGGLIKTGNGTLKLTGNNTYKGNSIVKRGLLEIYGVHSSAISVEKEGTLALYDKALIGYDNGKEPFIEEKTISADKIRAKNVDNSGRLEVIGKNIIIGGDYNAKKGSVTTMDIDSKLNVLGNINIEENTKLELEAKNADYISKKTKKIIAEANKINGAKNMDVEVDEMINVDIVSTENGIVEIEVERDKAINHLTTHRASSLNTAINIEKVLKDIDEKIELGTISGTELKMAKALQKMSKASFTSITKKMSGEIYASAQALTFSQAQDNNRVLSNHLANIDRLNESSSDYQFWISAIGSDGKLKKSGYAEADTKVVGEQMGIDKKISDSTIVGVGLSYSYGKADFNDYAGKAKSNMVGLSIYGKKEFQNNFYALGRFGLSHITSKVERDLIDENGNTVEGKIRHKDYLSSFYLEVGKKFSIVSPYIAFSQDYLRRGSFSESNATWGIHSKSKDYFASNLIAGLRAEYEINDYSLQSYINHAVNVGDRSLNYEGTYTGNSTKQIFKGINLPKNSIWVGLGVFKNITDNFGISANIDARLEDKKSKNIIYSTALQYKF